MREILFRGKDKETGEWVEGCLYLCHDGTCEISSYNDDFNIERWTSQVTNESVGQYTGVNDKNGRKIFEGDIVRINEKYVDAVIFSNGCFCMDRQIMMFEFTYQYFDKIEVIGNIHDNPELLKEGK